MVLLEKLKNEIEILPVDRKEVHPLVLKHYLQQWPVNVTQIYGIYHKVSEQKLIGMAIYGQTQKAALTSLDAHLHQPEVLELKRLYIEDGSGLSHIESYVIAKTLKMIKHSFPEVKVVITFADDKEGHVGTIYQATNAIYLGKTTGGLHKYAYILRGNIDSLRSKLQSKPYPNK